MMLLLKEEKGFLCTWERHICFNWKRYWIRRWARKWIRRWIRYGYWIRGWVTRHWLQWRRQWESWSQTKFCGSCEGFSALKVSDWAVVYDIASSSKSKNSIQYFISQILEVILVAVFQITFFRPQYFHKCAQYKWPSGDDVDTCDFDNIVEVLLHPKMTRRGAVTF